MEDSYLDEGFLLEKKPGMYQPQRVENAKISIANIPMETDKVKVFASKVRVDSVAKVAEIEAAEKKKMDDKVNKIIGHDINVFLNRQLIYNYPEQLFADAKIMAIKHADFEGIERLALVLGGEIVSTFDTPEAVKFGKCDLIEKVIFREDELLRFSGVQKAEQSLHDALCVLTTHARDARTVPGAGAPETLMAAVLMEAQKVAGKESIAVWPCSSSTSYNHL
uniref:T-complex protein 1 subunit beta n=1 Tax=Panagrolaimus davidi TaxID=227884 RepID=A0A914Q2W0_9BILA